MIRPIDYSGIESDPKKKLEYIPINESIQQANFKACCGKRFALLLYVFSVVQLLFLVINLSEDGKLGVEFAKLSAFWSLLICGNLLCN